MAINVFTRPGQLSWTDNTIYYLFFYNLLPANTRLQVQLLNASGAFVTEVMYYLDSSKSIFLLPLQDLIRPLTSYKRPENIVAGSATANCEEAYHFADVSIRWRVVYTGSSANYLQETTFKAIRGGIGDMNFLDAEYINSYTGDAPVTWLPKSAPWLTWVPSGRMMRPDEFGWLTWICTTGSGHSLQYAVTYLDGTAANFNKSIDPAHLDYKNRLFYIPIGVRQAGLDPANKGVAYYFVIISNGITTTAYKINVDNLPRYDALTLYYRNSLGGWDNISINGSIERSTDIEKLEYEQRGLNSANGYNNYYASSFRPKWKGFTGYLSKEHCIALNDLLNSQECALLYGGKWLPVRMTTKSIKYLDTKDGLHAVQLDFEAAGSFTSFPKQLLYV